MYFNPKCTPTTLENQSGNKSTHISGTSQMLEALKHGIPKGNLRIASKAILRNQMYLLYSWFLAYHCISTNKFKLPFIKKLLFNIRPFMFDPSDEEIDLYLSNPKFLWKFSKSNYSCFTQFINRAIEAPISSIDLVTSDKDKSPMMPYLKTNMFNKLLKSVHLKKANSTLKQIDNFFNNKLKFSLDAHQTAEAFYSDDFVLHHLNEKFTHEDFVHVILTGTIDETTHHFNYFGKAKSFKNLIIKQRNQFVNSKIIFRKSSPQSNVSRAQSHCTSSSLQPSSPTSSSSLSLLSTILDSVAIVVNNSDSSDCEEEKNFDVVSNSSSNISTSSVLNLISSSNTIDENQNLLVESTQNDDVLSIASCTVNIPIATNSSVSNINSNQLHVLPRDSIDDIISNDAPSNTKVTADENNKLTLFQPSILLTNHTEFEKDTNTLYPKSSIENSIDVKNSNDVYSLFIGRNIFPVSIFTLKQFPLKNNSLITITSENVLASKKNVLSFMRNDLVTIKNFQQFGTFEETIFDYQLRLTTLDSVTEKHSNTAAFINNINHVENLVLRKTHPFNNAHNNSYNYKFTILYQDLKIFVTITPMSTDTFCFNEFEITIIQGDFLYNICNAVPANNLSDMNLDLQNIVFYNYQKFNEIKNMMMHFDEFNYKYENQYHIYQIDNSTLDSCEASHNLKVKGTKISKNQMLIIGLIGKKWDSLVELTHPLSTIFLETKLIKTAVYLHGLSLSHQRFKNSKFTVSLVSKIKSNYGWFFKINQN